MRATAPIPQAVLAGPGLLALAADRRARGQRGLDVLERRQDRASPGR